MNSTSTDDYRFASEIADQSNFYRSIVETSVEWQRACEREAVAQSLWSVARESGNADEAQLYTEFRMTEEVRKGWLAQLALLTRRYMKAASVALTLFLLAISVSGQAIKRSDFLKPQPIDTSAWRKPTTTIASSAVCFGGVTADLLTSRGLIEGNPLLRNSNGSPNLLRAGLIGFGSCGATYFVDRKHPKAATILRFAIGAAHGLVAIHNRRLK